MSREAHVQFCESLGVRFPGATHPEGIFKLERMVGGPEPRACTRFRMT